VQQGVLGVVSNTQKRKERKKKKKRQDLAGPTLEKKCRQPLEEIQKSMGGTHQGPYYFSSKFVRMKDLRSGEGY